MWKINRTSDEGIITSPNPSPQLRRGRIGDYKSPLGLASQGLFSFLLR
ncbi:MAG: hypothetical protein UW11_C0012G0015 [Parcubacteria group bacterium GW2011_GWA2_43_9b]|nr:MAG: hypothetical protein UW11_C0012G0015 [Parcubacteria group bacterium GW2011_GWA2_43_9b]